MKEHIQIEGAGFNPKYWEEEFRKGYHGSKMGYTDFVVSGNKPPSQFSKYKLFLENFPLKDKHVDAYRANNSSEEWTTLYLHVKE